MTFPQKLQIGGRLTSFPGRSWNAIIDGHQAARGTPGPRQTPGRSRVAPAAVGVQVHNDSGSSVPAGGVLSLGDPAVSIDAFDAQIYQRPFFTGSTPATATLDSLFCVLAERLPDGKIATGYVQGITWARVDINTAGDNVCGLADGNRDYLESGTGSTPILYSEKQDDGTKTGEQWALVQLGAAPAALGTMLAEVDTGGISAASYAAGTLTYGSGDVHPLEDQGDDTADVDTGTTIEVFNSVPDYSIAAGRVVQCVKLSGKWFVVEPAVATMVLGTADGAVVSTDATFTIDNVTILQGWDFSITGASSTLTVTNQFDFDIDDGGDVLAIRKPGGSTYYGIQALCPAP